MTPTCTRRNTNRSRVLDRAVAAWVVSISVALAACAVEDRVELEDRSEALGADDRDVPSAPVAPRAGNLLWEDFYDASPFEQAFAAAAVKDRVFAAGFVWNPAGRDFVVRGYDGNTGEIAWQDQLDRGSDDFASGVTSEGGRVLVSGTSVTAGRGADWILRAYDAGNGEVLWTDVFDLDGGSDFSRGTALAAADGIVVLGGYGHRADGSRDWVLRAHDTATGELVWEDRRDVGRDGGAYTVVVHEGRLFAGGWIHTATADRAIVRAYDLQSGDLLWDHATPGVAGDSLTYTRSLAVDGGKVFAGQNVSADGAGDLLPRVTAFDAETGEVLWYDEISTGGSWEILHQISASGGHLVSVGQGGPGCGTGNCDAVVRGYSVRTGRLQWQRVEDLSGSDDRGNLVTVAGGRAFVLSSKHGEWALQAFEPVRGDLLWQAAGGEGEIGIYNMVATRERLFIPGRAVDPVSGDWDFLMRAYDTRGRFGDIDIGGVAAPGDLVLTGADGETSYEISAADPESVELVVRGLVPADEQAGTVADDPANDIGVALQTGEGMAVHFITVPEGTSHLRVSLFDDAVDGQHDLDLYLFDSSGSFIDASGSFTSNEHVDVRAPAPGDYIVVVHGYETEGPQASYTLFSWALGHADEGNLQVSGPTAAGVVTASWSGLTAGLRYLGAIGYREDGVEVEQTMVQITP